MKKKSSSPVSRQPKSGDTTDHTLPICKIALFKHGIGYFERVGAIRGDATVDLFFKAAEMNDVLKSLTTLDLDNGLIASISYESTKPVEKQLEDTSLHLSDNNSLTNLLSQAKGARVYVHVGAKQITGTVIGIETVTRKENDTTLTSYRLALLVNGESLQSYDLLDITSIVFLDESLRKDLQHLLDILISAKKKDLKKLTIFAKGKGERRILASYVVETPVWKTSYRLLLGKGKPLLQGWALVDNTQDEDWENVELSLVAGLPVSFIHDLYSPRYQKRPIVQVQAEQAYAPPVLEMADEIFTEEPERARMPFAAAAAPMPSLEKTRLAKRSVSASLKEDARQRSVEVQTRTMEAGDLFHYKIKNPVTVKRGQSALVPILQTTFDGKRVAVYNTEVRAKNPISAILFKNTTGNVLEGGPMTVLEDEYYAGEAMIETIKPDEERLIPFSVELGCVISIDTSKKNMPYYLSRIVRGTMHLHRYVIDTRTYIINNKSGKPLDLFLEHRFNPGWELVETAAPAERTGNFYRFRIDAPPKTTTRFAVNEKISISESIEIQRVSQDIIGSWVNSKYISSKIAKQIEELVSLNSTVSALQHKIGLLNKEIEVIFTNQKRLRENLKALGNSESERGLRDRYVSELSAEEDKLREHRDAIQVLEKEKEKTESELCDRLASLEFEQML
ncbi:MAG: DUF4139 domain-containing protein [Gammaproteobacteria bacterium]|nr:DUF4139 domain-containing protein [Gammaproteobacteria bacterium]